MENVITVILVGKSFLIKSGIETFLSEFSSVVVPASFDGTEPGLDTKIQTLKPDIVIFNPAEPFLEIKPLLQSLSKGQGTSIIAVTDVDMPNEIRGKFNEVISTDVDKMELTKVINKVLVEKGLKSKPEEVDHRLSERETDILKHVAFGYTNQEIADRLFLSIHTVTTHRKNITRKLGIKTVSGLTVYALMNKLILPSQVEKQS